MKNKKIIAIAVPIAVILIVIIIILATMLPTCNGGSVGDEDPCINGHTYVYTPDGDTNHKKTCEKCTKVNETEKHVFEGNEGMICELCHYDRTVISPHEHVDAYESVSDTQHRHYCETCNDLNVNENHVFEGDGLKCTLCEYEKHVHSFEYSDVDETTHKKSCTGCEDIKDVEEDHVYDEETGKCVCGKVKAPEIDAPSNVTITTDKNELRPGDEFTVTVLISADMPDCVWHSVELLIAPVIPGDNNRNLRDEEATSYLEYISYSTELSTTNYYNQSGGSFNISRLSSCGLKVSISNKFVKDIYEEETLASHDISISYKLKLKEDAPVGKSFEFGLITSRQKYITYWNLNTGETIKHQADNTILTTDASNNKVLEDKVCIAVNSVPVSIVSKED